MSSLGTNGTETSDGETPETETGSTYAGSGEGSPSDSPNYDDLLQSVLSSLGTSDDAETHRIQPQRLRIYLTIIFILRYPRALYNSLAGSRSVRQGIVFTARLLRRNANGAFIRVWLTIRCVLISGALLFSWNDSSGELFIVLLAVQL